MVCQCKQNFRRRLLHFLSVFCQSCLFHIFGLCKKWKFWEIKSRASSGLSEKNNSGHALLEISSNFYLWQLGHMGTIHGVYSDFDLISIILSSLATLLALLLLAMAIFRKDKKASRRFASSYTGSARG